MFWILNVLYSDVNTSQSYECTKTTIVRIEFYNIRVRWLNSEQILRMVLARWTKLCMVFLNK